MNVAIPYVNPLVRKRFDLSDGSQNDSAAFGSSTNCICIMVGANGCYADLVESGSPDVNTATATVMWLPANSVLFFRAKPGGKFGCKQTSGATIVTLLEMKIT